MRIVITPDALADLDSIHAFIASDSLQNAGAVIERLIGEIDSLGTMSSRAPIVGISRSRSSKVHALVVRPHIVYYRVDPQVEAVVVLRVRHGAQRRLKKFN